ncbi:UNKNOWN [Stylonychia lemnae]|uniref:Uncharacterized protein n=1 Tax=Stylonychia lemnae TaxID=5949 RepID=A0A077ZY70_STYLE|nr:UNKNOWN [Stylonychia lemnae]|eukprot:CDW74821.1 UNKNOWN [Stylonychia lemnae]
MKTSESIYQERIAYLKELEEDYEQKDLKKKIDHHRDEILAQKILQVQEAKDKITKLAGEQNSKVIELNQIRSYNNQLLEEYKLSSDDNERIKRMNLIKYQESEDVDKRLRLARMQLYKKEQNIDKLRQVKVQKELELHQIDQEVELKFSKLEKSEELADELENDNKQVHFKIKRVKIQLQKVTIEKNEIEEYICETDKELLQSTIKLKKAGKLHQKIQKIITELTSKNAYIEDQNLELEYQEKSLNIKVNQLEEYNDDLKVKLQTLIQEDSLVQLLDLNQRKCEQICTSYINTTFSGRQNDVISNTTYYETTMDKDVLSNGIKDIAYELRGDQLYFSNENTLNFSNIMGSPLNDTTKIHQDYQQQQQFQPNNHLSLNMMFNSDKENMDYLNQPMIISSSKTPMYRHEKTLSSLNNTQQMMRQILENDYQSLRDKKKQAQTIDFADNNTYLKYINQGQPINDNNVNESCNQMLDYISAKRQSKRHQSLVPVASSKLSHSFKKMFNEINQ